MSRINREINNQIAYKPDADQYGVSDYWIIPESGRGDCEDYALLKRKRLMEAGFNPGDLRMATCWTETGGYHAVLVVVSEDGSWWVLDNRYPDAMPWSRMEHYKWHKMQDRNGVWRGLKP